MTYYHHHWTLTAGYWKGDAQCLACNADLEGGGEFCSNECAVAWDEQVTKPLGEALANPKPTYTHDCERCKFLGTTKSISGRTVDLYVCQQRDPAHLIDTTFVGRYGNDGAEYASSLQPECFAGDPELHFARREPWYRLAILRAQELGVKLGG